MFIDCSQRLQDKIMEGLSGDDSCVFSPECILVNPNTEFQYTCRYVKSIGIFQDFLGSYMDTMQIEIALTPKEHATVMANLKDMECTLVLYPYNDKTLQPIYEQTPIIYKMKVVVDEQVDLEKKFNINMFSNAEVEKDDPNSYMTAEQHSLTIPFVFHCVEPEAYKLRHIKLNSVFSEVSAESLVHWVCQQFKVAETISVMPPDNKETMKNVILPPMQDISSVFPFIQERYAIYSKGLGYYFTDKSFYIYPPFDTKEESSPVKGTLHIINAPTKYFQGLDRYHSKIDDDILIVTISPVDLKPLNMEGTENGGNVHVSTNADRMRDNFVNVSSEGKVTRNINDISVIQMQNQEGNAKSDIQNVEYKGERTNVFTSTTQMAMINSTILTTSWIRAYPHLIKPGHNVLYHYDAALGIYKTQKGRIMQIFYGGQVHTSETEKPWVSFTATFKAFLEADKQSPIEV